MKEVSSLAGQRGFVRNFDFERAIDVRNGIVNVVNSWDLEGMVTIEEVATSDFCGRLQEV